MGNLMAKVLVTAGTIGASIVARKATDGTWRFVTGKDSPADPDDPEIDFKEAIAFALLSGMVIGVARMMANRETGRVVAKAEAKKAAKRTEKAEARKKA